MNAFFFRLAGYSFLFMVSIYFFNFDHATPGTDEPESPAQFWALYKMLYAAGLMLAVGGFFEKIISDKSAGLRLNSKLFVVPGVIMFFSGLKLQYDAGYIQTDLWYTYFYFFLFGIFILSVYKYILSPNRKKE
ncbi:MAG: hypothetical protein ACO3FI_05475 [Cyclobacteriaceae bacterium]